MLQGGSTADSEFPRQTETLRRERLFHEHYLPAPDWMAAMI